MKNTLSDLNNHLFMQIERLNDEDLDGASLKSEIERARQMANLADKVISNASLHVRAAALACNFEDTYKEDMVPMIKQSKKQGPIISNTRRITDK